MELGESSEVGNVEDRRGGSGKVLAFGGGIGAVVITIIASLFGFNPDAVKRLGVGGPSRGPGVQDGYKEFSSKVLGTTNAVWREQFKLHYNRAYEEPRMVLFSHEVDSEGCGIAPSEVGPFYCPRSKMVFLDPTFFETLEKRLGGSKAQFSQAYVIAHEVGHHVQNLLGYNNALNRFKGEGENAGIRLELQADYLAGVWAHHAQRRFKILSNPNEVQEALKTAKAIGDNRIQKKSRGWVSPESFNHGRDDQRYKYFKKGFDTGDARKETLDQFFNPRVRPLDL